MEESLYFSDAELAPSDVRLFMGAPASGRTSALCELACEHVTAGERVLMVATTEPGLAELGNLLADAPSDNLQVSTIADVALLVLDSPEARADFGREPRILESHEQDILMEDMRVSQMKNKRLKALSGYLFAGWSNLSDDKWEQTYEEDLFIERLRSNLCLTGGVLPSEASNLALKALRAHEGLRERIGFDWVIVDDFELASRASQHMLRALARKGFAAASALHPGPAAPAEPYPCYEGARELVGAVPQTKVTLLGESAQPAVVRAAECALACDDALASLMPAGFEAAAEGPGDAELAEEASAAADALSVHMEASPVAEMQVIAQSAADALNRGESVIIAGGDKLWRKNILTNFARAGLPVVQAPRRGMKGRDLEDQKVAARLERDAVTRLRANPNDNVAWRTMLAAGDHVARSAAIDRLRQAVDGQQVDGRPIRLAEAMERLAAGEFEFSGIDRPLMDDLLTAFERSKGLIAKVGDASVTDQAPSRKPSEGQPTAPTILLCSLDDLSGHHADTLIIGAFVNGVVPSRDYLDPAGLVGGARERQHVKDARRVYGALRAVRKRLVVTGFTSANLAIAETMDLHIASIKLRKGVRMALIEPSEFIEVMGLSRS